MTKTHVGLGDVDNTADTAKPVSTAQQSALDNKSDTGHGHVVGDVTGLQTALDGKAASSHGHANAVAGTSDGFMSKEDKTKINGIADNANNYVHP